MHYNHERLTLHHQCHCYLPEQPGISSQSSNGDTNVVVDMEDLLLVGRQFRLGSLQEKHDTSVVHFQLLCFDTNNLLQIFLAVAL